MGTSVSPRGLADKLQKEVDGLAGRLNSPKFVAKAPEAGAYTGPHLCST